MLKFNSWPPKEGEVTFSREAVDQFGKYFNRHGWDDRTLEEPNYKDQLFAYGYIVTDLLLANNCTIEQSVRIAYRAARDSLGDNINAEYRSDYEFMQGVAEAITEKLLQERIS